VKIVLGFSISLFTVLQITSEILGFLTDDQHVTTSAFFIVFLTQWASMNVLIVVGYSILYNLLKRQYDDAKTKFKDLMSPLEIERIDEDMKSLLVLFLSFTFYSVLVLPLSFIAVFNDVESLYGFSWWESILQLIQICGIIYAFRRRLENDILPPKDEAQETVSRIDS
jgi:hypothetical protein